MSGEEYPSEGQLDSLHLAMIENDKLLFKRDESDLTTQTTSESSPFDLEPSPLSGGAETEPYLSVQSSSNGLEDGDGSEKPALLGAYDGTDIVLEETTKTPLPSPDQPVNVDLIAPGSAEISEAKPSANIPTIKDDTNPTAANPKEERRSSLELRLQNVVRSNRSDSKPPPSTIITKAPTGVVMEEPQTITSLYDVGIGASHIKGMGSHRDLTLMPVETNLIYGPSHDASLILNDLKAESTSTKDGGKDSATSASSWLSKTPSLLEEPKFHLVFPSGDAVDLASTKRNMEFHDLFPALDPLDRLVDDFTCAWLTDMLLHGRMYITQNNVCFHTKVIWTYQCVIPLSEMVSVEKKVVGRLFDNALEIYIKDKNYYFTSFLSRNQAYDLIIKVSSGYPNSSVELKPNEPIKRTSSKSSLVAGDGGRRSRSMGSMDEHPTLVHSRTSIGFDDSFNRKTVGLAEIVSPTSMTGTTPFSNSPEKEGASPHKSPESHASSSVSNAATSNSKKYIVHQKHKVSTPTTAELANASTKIAPHPSSPPKKIIPKTGQDTPYECACMQTLHKTQNKCLDTTVQLSVMESWQYLYSFESLHMAFCHKLWTKLGFTGIKGSDWLPPDSDFTNDTIIYNSSAVTNPCSFESLKAGWKRKIEYTRPIANPVGPKISKVLITEKIVSCSSSHLCIESSSSTPSAPSGDCFLVNTRFCIMAQSPTTSRLVTSCAIEYLKSTWMKVVLDTAVPGGVKEYQTAMAKELDLYIKSGGIPKLEVKSTEAPAVGNSSTAADPLSSQSGPSPPNALWSNWTTSVVLVSLFATQLLLNVLFLFFYFKLHDRVERIETMIGDSSKSSSGSHSEL